MSKDPSEYVFFKDHKKDKIWWVSTGKKGDLAISFDKVTVLHLFSDYPWKFTKEQKELFDKEQPYWALFFSGRN